MSRRILVLVLAFASALLALITAPVLAVPAQTDLKVYLARVKELYTEAEVTGSFYDWRAVSMYRASAGLHLGYDIALNAGRPVPAGWPGTVVGIIPWTDTEYGVCVQLANGYRVTYGHIFPTVKEGDTISAGQFVGTVARDHVDIKVRDAGGGYFDWGLAVGVLGGTSAWVPGGSMGLLPPPSWMRGSSAPVGLSVDGLVERYRAQALEAAAREAERDRVRTVVKAITAFMNLEAQGLPQAESQMLAWYRAADQNKVSEAQVEAISLTVKARRCRVTRLGYLIAARQRDLAEKEAACLSARASADAARTAAFKAGATEERLAAIDTDARKSNGPRATATTPVDDRVRLAASRYAQLKSRYPGGCSQTDLEEAEKVLKRLQVAQGLYGLGCRNDAFELSW